MTDSLNPAEAACPHIVTSDEGTSYCTLAEQTHEGCVPREEHERSHQAVFDVVRAEVEALRAENERHQRANLVRAVLHEWDEAKDGALIDYINEASWDAVPWKIGLAFRDENEALRAALDEIANYGGGDGGDWVECCNLARAALAASTSTEPQP